MHKYAVYTVRSYNKQNIYTIFLTLTFPRGNLARKPADLFVVPNLKPVSTVTLAPLYSAAIRALKALKLPGYVYRV